MWPQRLLACGVVLGPQFFLIVAIQMATRAGFDIGRHPLSLLSLGDHGWVQTANFLVAGLLALGCALGMRSHLRGECGGAWGPLLIGTYGLGMLVAGLFPADPAHGFPPGTPDGVPGAISRSAKLHGVGFLLAFGSLTAACLVLARRFHRAGHRGWMRFSAVTGAAIPPIVLAGMSIPSATSLLFALVAVIGFGWVSAVAARLYAEPVALGRAGPAVAGGPART
jgi:hypothetical protein